MQIFKRCVKSPVFSKPKKPNPGVLPVDLFAINGKLNKSMISSNSQSPSPKKHLKFYLDFQVYNYPHAKPSSASEFPPTE